MSEGTKPHGHAFPDPTIRSPRAGRHAAQISKLLKLSHDTLEVVLTCDADQPPLRASAGQFCTISIAELARPRAYSVARAPEREKKNEHTFIIRLVADGEFSQWLTRQDRIGAMVELSGPLGTFALDKSESPLVCIAGGSGMSAIFSIIEQAQASQVRRDCYFFYGARAKADLYYGDKINDIRAAWNTANRFEFIPVLSDEKSTSDWSGATGLVGEEAIAYLRTLTNFDLPTASYFLCGPPVMVDTTVAHLRDHGVSEGNCYFDRFDDVRSPAPVIDNHRCVLCDECLLVKPSADCIVESADVRRNGASPTRIEPARTSGLYYNGLVIDESKCIRCNACVDACPHDAISTHGAAVNSSLRHPSA